MDFMDRVDSLLKECSTHWTTGSEILYPMRSLYQKGHDFAPYRVVKKLRTDPTRKEIRNFIKICRAIEDSLDIEDHRRQYYLELQQNRFVNYINNNI